jgi:NADPH2:quinone reductase
MKALQCIELGGPEKLIVSEIPDPVIAEEHVIIEVRSASVNFPDVLMIQGLIPISTPSSFYTGR